MESYQIELPLCLRPVLYVMNNVDIASFSDDNTPYLSANDLPALIKPSEDAASSIFKWLIKSKVIQANVISY